MEDDEIAWTMRFMWKTTGTSSGKFRWRHA